MSNAQPKKSFQWMTSAGVSVSDAQWMEAHFGLPEMHQQPFSGRIETIYQTALENMMSGPSRVELSRKATLN